MSHLVIFDELVMDLHVLGNLRVLGQILLPAVAQVGHPLPQLIEIVDLNGLSRQWLHTLDLLV